MEKIKEYLSVNPQYVTALIITAAILVAACVLGYFIKKYDLLKFMDGWFKKKKKHTDEDGQEADDEPTEAEESADTEEFTADDTDDGEIYGETETTYGDKADGEPEPAREKEENEDGEARPQNSDRFSALIKQSLESEKTDAYEKDKHFVPRENAKKERVRTEKREEETQTPAEPDYEGKWRILRSGNTFVAQLHNDADVILLRSDHYSSVIGAKNAVENLKKNVKGNNFSIAVTGGEFCFKLFSPSGRLICTGEPCATRAECKARIEEVKRIAFKAEVVRG